MLVRAVGAARRASAFVVLGFPLLWDQPGGSRPPALEDSSVFVTNVAGCSGQRDAQSWAAVGQQESERWLS